MERFSESEKAELWDRFEAGKSLRSISRRLGRAPSTLCRTMSGTSSTRHGSRATSVGYTLCVKREEEHESCEEPAPDASPALPTLDSRGHRSAQWVVVPTIERSAIAVASPTKNAVPTRIMGSDCWTTRHTPATARATTQTAANRPVSPRAM